MAYKLLNSECAFIDVQSTRLGLKEGMLRHSGPNKGLLDHSVGRRTHCRAIMPSGFQAMS